MPAHPVSPDLHDWIAVVVEDNTDDLLRYLQRRVTHPEDAADLLGHVLLALWVNGARVPTTDTDARMWCFGIARNVLREHYRHTAKRLALAGQLREHLRDTALQDNAASTAAEARIRAEGVRTAVVALDKRSRELVMLVHWDGFSIAEAARLLSMNESTARTRHSRALKRLEQKLTERHAHPGVARSTPQPDLTTG